MKEVKADSLAALHYYVIVGQVMFYEATKEDEVGTATLNAVISAETPYLTVTDLGRAQQAVQLQLHNRSPGVQLEVVDVILTNICPIGHMTPLQFLGDTQKPKAEA